VKDFTADMRLSFQQVGLDQNQRSNELATQAMANWIGQEIGRLRAQKKRLEQPARLYRKLQRFHRRKVQRNAGGRLQISLSNRRGFGTRRSLRRKYGSA
jgi:hypothetical protein